MSARKLERSIADRYVGFVFVCLATYYGVAVAIPDGSPLHVLMYPIFAVAWGWMFLYSFVPVGGQVVAALTAIVYLYLISVAIATIGRTLSGN